MEKLAAFCRGGYSLKVARNCPTYVCAGTITYACLLPKDLPSPGKTVSRTTPGSGSKNLLLSIGHIYRVTEHRSYPNTHVHCDRLPAEALCAKCGNPLLVDDSLGTIQLDRKSVV